MEYTIYKHISPSKKFYIGITSEGMKKRWLKHCRKARFNSTTNFHKAIRKYGEINWQHEILCVFRTNDKKYAYQIEQSYIDMYDALKKGYNMDLGYGWNIVDRRGFLNPMYGRISGNAHKCSIKGKVFPSISNAANRLNVNRNTIAKWICKREDCFKF